MVHWKHTEEYLTCLKEHMFLLFVYLNAHVLSGIWHEQSRNRKLLWAGAGAGVGSLLRATSLIRVTWFHKQNRSVWLFSLRKLDTFEGIFVHTPHFWPSLYPSLTPLPRSRKQKGTFHALGSAATNTDQPVSYSFTLLWKATRITGRVHLKNFISTTSVCSPMRPSAMQCLSFLPISRNESVSHMHSFTLPVAAFIPPSHTPLYFNHCSYKWPKIVPFAFHEPLLPDHRQSSCQVSSFTGKLWKRRLFSL